MSRFRAALVLTGPAASGVLHHVFPGVLRDHSWVEGVIAAGVLAAVLSSMNRRVPWQNLAGAGAWVAAGTAGILALTGRPGAVFGDLGFGARAGLSWQGVVAGMLLVFGGRETARVVVRPLRGGPNCGLWLMGTGAVLAAAMGLALAPYVVAGPPGGSGWRAGPAIPWGVVPGWFAGALGLQVLAGSWLLKLKPVASSDDTTVPALWLGALGYLALGCAARGLEQGMYAGAGAALVAGVALAWSRRGGGGR